MIWDFGVTICDGCKGECYFTFLATNGQRYCIRCDLARQQQKDEEREEDVREKGQRYA